MEDISMFDSKCMGDFLCLSSEEDLIFLGQVSKSIKNDLIKQKEYSMQKTLWNPGKYKDLLKGVFH